MNQHESPQATPEAPVVNGEHVIHDTESDRYLLREPSRLRTVLTSRRTRVGAVALAVFVACNAASYEALALGGAHSWETPAHDLQNFNHVVGKVASAVISIGEHL